MPRRVDPSRRCLVLAVWPPRDRAAFEAAFRPGDIFEDDGAAAHWSERTVAKVCAGYGRWLGWLEGRRQLDPTTAPEHRVSRERLKLYLDDVARLNAPFTVYCRVQELHMALRAMAPNIDWTWLGRIEAALRARATPARNKRARLKPAGELEALGRRLMAKAEAILNAPLKRAVGHRDGLMIALLARRPLRLKNFAALMIGRHLVRTGSIWSIRIDADEMKNKRRFDAAFPAALVGELERYLADYRPTLLSRGGRQAVPDLDALWISEIGTALGASPIHHRIRKHTKAAFGNAIPPHWFRDAATTTIATDDPVHARSAMNILGDASPEIAEKHYNQAQGLQAGRRHARVIADLGSNGDAMFASSAGAKSTAAVDLRRTTDVGVFGPDLPTPPLEHVAPPAIGALDNEPRGLRVASRWRA